MSYTPPSEEEHLRTLRLCLKLAAKAPALPTNYCVGAVLMHEPSKLVLSTGYTNELPGNTHAEQVCLQKRAQQRGVAEEDLSTAEPLMQPDGPGRVVLYTTMEPCVKRLSTNKACVDRILETRRNGAKGIAAVYVGVEEPNTFVDTNNSRAKLEEAGVEVFHITGLEDEILKVATAGHEQT